LSEQGEDFGAKLVVAGAGLGEERGAFRGGALQGRLEELLDLPPSLAVHVGACRL
jgi:hypothetical protein